MVTLTIVYRCNANPRHKRRQGFSTFIHQECSHDIGTPCPH